MLGIIESILSIACSVVVVGCTLYQLKTNSKNQGGYVPVAGVCTTTYHIPYNPTYSRVGQGCGASCVATIPARHEGRATPTTLIVVVIVE
ncbi:hypothetical protein CN917_16615 [Bacillus thuringiensis]|nr:hypothetical protein CN917_16615 [Bacillus thuringiensis]